PLLRLPAMRLWIALYEAPDERQRIVRRIRDNAMPAVLELAIRQGLRRDGRRDVALAFYRHHRLQDTADHTSDRSHSIHSQQSPCAPGGLRAAPPDSGMGGDSARRCIPDHAILPELLHFVAAVSERAHDLRRVLAVRGRTERHATGFIRKLDRYADVVPAALVLQHHAARLEVRVFEHLGKRLHRRERDVASLEPFYPLGLRPGPERRPKEFAHRVLPSSRGEPDTVNSL